MLVIKISINCLIILRLVACYVVDIGSSSNSNSIIDDYSNNTKTNHIYIPRNESLIGLLQTLHAEKEISCQSDYLSTMDTVNFRYIMELLAFNCQRKFKYFDPAEIKLSLEGDGEHDIMYSDKYITNTYTTIDNGQDPLVGILTYGSCQNFLVTRLSAALSENKIFVFCDSIHKRSGLRLNTLLTNFQKMDFVVLALSHTDALMSIKYYSNMEGDLAKIIIFGFSTIQADVIKKEYSHLDIINIPFKEEDIVIRNENSNLVDSEVLQRYFNHSSGGQEEYHRLKTIAMESIYDDEASVIKRLENSSFLYKRQKIYVNCTGAIYSPFLFILQDSIPDSVGHCQLGRLCHVPNVKSGNTVWTTSCCHGLSVEILDGIAQELDFHFDIYLVEDGAFGGIVNGKWNGMVGQLAYGHSDIAVQGLTPTNARSEVIDFSPGYIKTHLGMVRKILKREIEIINWEFLDPLEFWLMIFILLSTVIVVLMIYFIENSTWYFLGVPHFPFRESMTYVFGLTFQRDMGGKNPLKWSGRFVALGYAAAMTIVMTTYTAHITANNIGYTEDDGFEGLKDKRITDPASKYIIATMGNTSSEMFFKNSHSDIYKNVWKRMVLVGGDKVGVEKVYNGEVDVFLSDNVYVQGIISEMKYCTTLTMYDEMRRQTEVAFGMRKGFYLNPHITRTLLRLLESGFVDEVLKKWLYVPTCDTYQSEDQSFPWFYFGGILLFLGICFGFSIIVNFVENLYTYIKTKRTQGKINKEWKSERSLTYSSIIENPGWSNGSSEKSL